MYLIIILRYISYVILITRKCIFITIKSAKTYSKQFLHKFIYYFGISQSSFVCCFRSRSCCSTYRSVTSWSLFDLVAEFPTYSGGMNNTPAIRRAFRKQITTTLLSSSIGACLFLESTRSARYHFLARPTSASDHWSFVIFKRFLVMTPEQSSVSAEKFLPIAGFAERSIPARAAATDSL